MDKEWQKNAKDTLKDLKKIDPQKATKDQFLLMGAALAILDHPDIGIPISPTAFTTDDPHARESSGDQIVCDIKDELGDAEKYLNRYPETQDQDYLTLAYDETTHALKFIRELLDGEEKRQYMTQHDNLIGRIKMYGMSI